MKFALQAESPNPKYREFVSRGSMLDGFGALQHSQTSHGLCLFHERKLLQSSLKGSELHFCCTAAVSCCEDRLVSIQAS